MKHILFVPLMCAEYIEYPKDCGFPFSKNLMQIGSNEKLENFRAMGFLTVSGGLESESQICRYMRDFRCYVVHILPD